MEKDGVYIHPSSIIDSPVSIGSGTKIWHFCHIMPGVKIGKNCSFGQNVFIGEGVVIGDNVKVQNNVSIYSGVEIESNVFLGPSMVFTNVINPRSEVNRQGEYQRTLIKSGVTIGANATIICGNTLHSYAFIGAGAVVSKDTPAYALIVGNPAKQIGWMSEAGERLQFSAEGEAICSMSKQRYQLIKEQVKKVE